VHASSTSAQRIGVELAAADALDATVGVYRAVRSQLQEVTCEKASPRSRSKPKRTSSTTFVSPRWLARSSRASRSASSCLRPR
jgi:hypothetical protein